jgi:FkbM family methyltransferase
MTMEISRTTNRFPREVAASYPALPVSAPEENIVVTISAGRLAGMKLVLNERSSQLSHFRGGFKWELQEALFRELKPGQVFFDAGAHSGYTSLLGARAVGPRGKVFAFEGNPENARVIETQVRVNGLANVYVINTSIGDPLGSVMVLRDEKSGIRQVLDIEQSRPNIISVPPSTIDMHIQNCAVPDVVKIEIRGAELSVLEGARKLLASHHPVLFIEVHGAEGLPEIQGFLASFGYAVSDLNGGKIAQRPYPRFIMAKYDFLRN